MKIYKSSAAMYETFGTEEKLISSFQKHLDLFLKTHNKNQIKKLLDNDKTVVLGSMFLDEILKDVFARHGKPKNKVPDSFYFCIRKRRKNEDRKAYVSGNYSGTPLNSPIWFVLVVDDPSQIIFDEKAKLIFQHELQHIIRIIYEGHIRTQYSPDEAGGTLYYSDPWEIQSFSATLAQKSFNQMREIMDFRFQQIKDNPEKIKATIDKQSSDEGIKANVKIFLVPAVKHFMEILAKEGKLPTQQAIKEYYLSSLRNFIAMSRKYWFDKLASCKNHN